MTASRWTTPAPRACRRAASTCRRPIAAPIPASASSAWWRPRSRTTGPASRRSAWRSRRAASSTRRIPIRFACATSIGQLLPDLMMGCLHQAVPERVTAEGASALWNPPLRGGSSVSGQARGNRPVLPDFEIITFNSGGTGARPTQDGLDGTAFPSGVRTMPVEATENVAPVIFWQKELRAGFRRRRPHPRRLRPDHGDRRQGRPGIRRQRHLRPRRQSRRRAARAGDGAAGGVALKIRQDAAHQGLPGHPRRRPADPEAAGRRRHGRPDAARPGAGGARRARWPGVRAVAREVYKVAVNDDGSIDTEETRRLRAGP